MPEIPIAEFLTRLCIAVVLGAFIGIERQVSHHTAGLKTNALVSTGSALFVMLAGHPDQHPDAYSRIAAQIISGMGFLGGGVILRDGMHIRGLTTAATLWCAAGVGTLAGAGGPRRAALGCLAVLAINIFLKPLSRRLGEDSLTGEGVSSRYRIRIVCSRGDEQSVRAELVRMSNEHQLSLQGMKTEISGGMQAEVSGDFCSRPGTKEDIEPLVAGLGLREGVTTVDWQRVGA